VFEEKKSKLNIENNDKEIKQKNKKNANLYIVSFLFY